MKESLRSMVAALVPPPAAPGSRFAAALDARAAATLGIIGLALCVQPIAGVLVVFVALSGGRLGAAGATMETALYAFPALFAVGLGLRVAAGSPAAGRLARPLVAAGAIAFSGLIAWAEATFRTDGGPSLMPLGVLLGVTVMPFRPLVAIAITAAAVLTYDLVVAAGFTSSSLPFATRVRIVEASIPFEISALLVTAVMSSAVYRARARDISAELERDDLAEKARLQAADLAKTNRELVEAQSELVRQRHLASLGNLVAGVAHELNNPTGALRGAGDVLGRGLDVLEGELEAPSKKAARALASLRGAHASTREAATRIAKVVRSLRLFARLDEAEEQLVDLRACVDAAIDRLAPRLEGHVTLERQYAELPRVRCRPALLNEVFLELVGNALEAARSRVVVHTALEGASTVVVAILDDGPGIPAEHRERIFEPGFTTKGRGVGVGLGLSTAARIVAEHGGRIEARNAAGGGAELRVALPTA